MGAVEFIVGAVIFGAVAYFIINKKRKKDAARGPISPAPTGQDPSQDEIDAAERGD